MEKAGLEPLLKSRFKTPAHGSTESFANFHFSSVQPLSRV